MGDMERGDLEKIVKMAYDSDPKIRAEAADLLVNFEDDLAYQVLLELANDKESSVKEAAIRAIQVFKAKYKEKKLPETVMEKINAIARSQTDQSQDIPIKLNELIREIDTKRDESPESSREEFSMFDYIYNSLDKYRERPEVMRKHFENLRDYMMREMDLIYELIQSEDSFDITKIKNKMKILSTGELKIKSKEIKEFVEKRNKRKIKMYRFLVEDTRGREGIVYIYEDAGKKIDIGDVIKILNTEARSIVGTDETAIWVWRDDTVIWKRV
ncbi:MAG: HEAT repeat domain-containing protein [Candidatus Micrarchaeota archaeon]|nr:HEAT repeat domain-containing protein [Candidatus Micrarchaeota archaeon]MCX8154711.1 HEAT repeat domain-containing protein [Candidatus Micrarchaeota archaeon]